jgi:hypothetical protein
MRPGKGRHGAGSLTLAFRPAPQADLDLSQESVLRSTWTRNRANVALRSQFSTALHWAKKYVKDGAKNYRLVDDLPSGFSYSTGIYLLRTSKPLNSVTDSPADRDRGSFDSII